MVYPFNLLYGDPISIARYALAKEPLLVLSPLFNYHQ